MSTLSAAIAASASALNAERTRIEVAVSNLANAESTRGADGAARIAAATSCCRATPVTTFEGALGSAGATGVRVAAVVEDQAPFRRRYEPSHPDADADGFVALPNVEPAGGDGRHARRGPRLSGEPDRDRARSATCVQRALELGK